MLLGLLALQWQVLQVMLCTIIFTILVPVLEGHLFHILELPLLEVTRLKVHLPVATEHQADMEHPLVVMEHHPLAVTEHPLVVTGRLLVVMGRLLVVMGRLLVVMELLFLCLPLLMEVVLMFAHHSITVVHTPQEYPLHSQLAFHHISPIR